MPKHSYVADIYQWVIDDVVSKVHQDFIDEGVDDSLLNKLAREWERNIQEMKILETSDTLKSIRKSQTSLESPKGKIMKQSISPTERPNYPFLGQDCNQTKSYAQLILQLREYQDAVSLLSNQYSKIPKEKNKDRRYCYYLCQQYAAVVEKLRIYLQNFKIREIISSSRKDIKTHLDPSARKLQGSYGLVESGSSRDTQNSFSDHVVCNQSREINVSENGDECKERQKHEGTKNSLNRVCGVKVDHARLRSQPSKDLDLEDLSDLSDSSVGVSEVIENSSEDYMNRIDCCYEKIQLRKMGNKTKWQSVFKNGIMLIDGKEFVFHEATVNLIWNKSDKECNDHKTKMNSKMIETT